MKRKTSILLSAIAIAMAGLQGIQAQSIPDSIQLGRGREYTVGFIGTETVTIDGNANESFWALAPFAEIDTSVAGTVHGEGIALTEEDFEGNFKLAWDAENLYIYVTAVDDTIVVGNGTAADNIEIFFNTDGLWYEREINDHETQQFRDPYRDTKNFTASQIRVNVGNDNDITGGGYAYLLGDDTDYDFKSVTTDDGFEMEIKVPFAYILNPNALSTFVAEEGAELFFDISYGDVDNEVVGARQHILVWNAKNADGWKDVRLFATIVLGPSLVQAKNATVSNLSVYKTAAGSSLTVEHSDYQNCLSINIVNMLGQVVLNSSKVERVNTFSIDHMPAGVYMVSAVSRQGTITKKFVK